jgi:hypothetical protein
MPAKRLPATDEKRILAMQTFLDREEMVEGSAVLTPREFRDMKHFMLSYEGSCACVKQALDDEAAAAADLAQRLHNAQLYVSHFIQVLYLAAVRNEVKRENLAHYGLTYSDDFTPPDLSTEEAVLAWGNRLITGEAERTALGGTAIYSPPISKVKVHYDLFKETVHSLKIYRQNAVRLQESLEDQRDRADSLIWTAWTKIEFAAGPLPIDERDKLYKEYGLDFYHHEGEQLNVFG